MVILFTLLLIMGELGISREQIVSVVKDNKGDWQVVSGEAESWIVVANLTDTLKETGWHHLDIRTNEGRPDEEQAEGAGIAEGYLTRNLIYSYYKEFIHKDFCTVDPKFCEYTVKNMQENQAWIKKQVQVDQANTEYWKMVRLFYLQLSGLKTGWLISTRKDNLAILPDFDIDWFTHFINFYPDIGDYIHNYKKTRTKTPRKIRSATPSCSVLIKRLQDGDILVGHATWHEYRAMAYRMIKRYNLNYHMGRDTVQGHTISMTSYAGNIFSLDDFYTISSGLTSLETTLFVYNKALYDQNSPSGQLWEPVRVMVANRLATTGKQWVELFSKHNSGTYNNQWMVVDYKKARQGSWTGVLWVVEQIPGSLVSRDMTEHLTTTSYWASYNRAFFQETFLQTGGQEITRLYGDWFSHDKNPRAREFQAHQHTVVDQETMMELLRSNNYQSSSHSTPAGCSGSIPSAAIAARADLQSVNISCSWEREDYMVGHRAYGAIDAKVVSATSAEVLGFLAVAGPTTGKQSLPPFSWSSSGFPVPDFAPVNTYTFQPFQVMWTGGYTSRNVFDEEEGEEGGTEVNLNNAGFKLSDLINKFFLVFIHIYNIFAF